MFLNKRFPVLKWKRTNEEEAARIAALDEDEAFKEKQPLGEGLAGVADVARIEGGSTRQP